MKKLSFQWRIAIITSLLIALSCMTLNFLVNHSNAYYFDTLGKYVFDYKGAKIPLESIEGGEDSVVIDMKPEEYMAFYKNFTLELAQAELSFRRSSWIITIVVSLVSGLVSFKVSGYFLRPLQDFAQQTEQIGANNLTEVRLKEETIPEFMVLSQSINKMLQRLDKAFTVQKQFIGNAAHELRTPLALMQARLDQYLDDHKGEESDGMETMALVSDQTDRLSRLVKTLLEISELEQVPRQDHIDLGPLVEEVLTDLGPVAEKKGISLKQDQGQANLVGSDLLIYRLLFNLVENGIKYNRPGGAVRVAIEEKDQEVLVRVEDTGIGIPEEEQKTIFQPFYRLDQARSHKKDSPGLGLSLVWDVAKLHGGQVKVEKSTPQGTSFLVRLPKDQGEE